MLRTLSRTAMVAAVVAVAPTTALTPANAVAPTATPAWRIADTVHHSGSTAFDGLTVAGARDVWVVGRADGPGPALARHWNGRAWRNTELPQPLRTSGLLRVAASSSPDNVWAFGTSGSSEYALRWDGRRWTTANSWERPGDGRFKGAVVLSPDDVWAFGGDASPNDDMGTWHFDGRSWARADVDHTLTAGSALTPTDIWAVGSQEQSDGTERSLVARWDGGHWSEVPTPDIPHEWSYPPVFTAIHAISPNDVWVVGTKVDRIDGDPRILPLALHWDGAEWAVIEVPGADGLRSVSSDAQGAVWVAGEVSCALLRYADGEWTCPRPPTVRGKVFAIQTIARTPKTGRLWSAGELVWGGLPSTDGVVLRQRR